MRLILDTNVLVSALIQRNYPYFIIDLVLADNTLQLCISDQLFAEYIEVLNREKFSKFSDYLQRFLNSCQDKLRLLYFNLAVVHSSLF